MGEVVYTLILHSYKDMSKSKGQTEDACRMICAPYPVSIPLECLCRRLSLGIYNYML